MAANGPVSMPQAPKPLCLIQFWNRDISFFLQLALCTNIEYIMTIDDASYRSTLGNLQDSPYIWTLLVDDVGGDGALPLPWLEAVS